MWAQGSCPCVHRAADTNQCWGRCRVSGKLGKEMPVHSSEGSFICSTRWDPRPKPHWLSEKQKTVQFLDIKSVVYTEWPPVPPPHPHQPHILSPAPEVEAPWLLVRLSHRKNYRRTEKRHALCQALSRKLPQWMPTESSVNCVPLQGSPPAMWFMSLPSKGPLPET